MATFSTDAAAKDVLAGADGLGAVMFKGWLEAVPEASPTKFRLYTDPQFLEWLEIPSDAMLHQIPGSDDANAERRSVIWVKREARITGCRSGEAYWFHELKEETADEPTSRWPRPRY